MDYSNLSTDEKLERLLNHMDNGKSTGNKRQAIFNAIYSVLGTIIVIAISFTFTFIMEIKSTNQRQDRDMKEQKKLDHQKWRSIDYNFQVLNKDDNYLIKIDDKQN